MVQGWGSSSTLSGDISYYSKQTPTFSTMVFHSRKYISVFANTYNNNTQEAVTMAAGGRGGGY